jgi:AtzE family amidohydrolase
MNINYKTMDAVAIASLIRKREISAKTVVTQCLDDINTRNPELNCFTTITADSAFKQADYIDELIAKGENPGAFAGVPFAVKNLYDIAGVTTIAGSIISAENPPATEDASAVQKLKEAGAILVGALNMDEYAYGFVTENSHYGATPNPQDNTRVAGGSSGGSAAAVGAGLVPLTLGSDTNGSIRVPAALCGVFGLKPTYGRISRAGVYLFSSSLDHAGPFARSLRDIATSFDVLQGVDKRDPVCSSRPVELCVPQLDKGLEGLRIAVAGDYFSQGGEEAVFTAVQKVAEVLNVTQEIAIPEAARARAAAYLITASEGANLHLESLRSRPFDFDPATRDRFLAGAFIPASWYIQAQRFRQWYRNCVREVFQEVDIIIAPTTPCVAPKLGQQTMVIEGQEILLRPNLGLYTQPLSFIGLPVLSVPVKLPNSLPLGVQIIAAPYNEALILRVAKVLEERGVISCF